MSNGELAIGGKTTTYPLCRTPTRSIRCAVWYPSGEIKPLTAQGAIRIASRMPTSERYDNPLDVLIEYAGRWKKKREVCDMRFRVIWSNGDGKVAGEALANRDDAWQLWYMLTKRLGIKCEVYNLEGVRCSPERGIAEFVDYNPYVT